MTTVSAGRKWLALSGWLLLSCTYGGPCPAVDDRFDPGEFGILPESTFDPTGCNGSGVQSVRPGMTVVACTPEWCVADYEGSYCVPGDSFESWRAGLGLGLGCVLKGGPEGTQLCYVECAECDGRCTLTRAGLEDARPAADLMPS